MQFNASNINEILTHNGSTVRINTTDTNEYQVMYLNPRGWWHCVDRTPDVNQAIYVANIWLEIKAV